eukprot:SAG25_NODE_8439_length_422_cov_0.984520_1_plen_34_part_01
MAARSWPVKSWLGCSAVVDSTLGTALRCGRNKYP